ncbi:MAG TPA: DUF6455 family protein [Rhodopila sp.]|nr:DUF6455 family protein [Rhodopila sp.]
MSTSTTHTLVGRALDWIRARRSIEAELATLSRADVQMLATDIGVTEADLRDVAPLVADHSDLLDEMMLARGLDPAAVRRAFAGVARDMAVTCARCRDSGTCRRKLADGTAAAEIDAFCGNAAIIASLLDHQAETAAARVA